MATSALSIAEAATTLNVSTKTIRRYIASGQLTAYRVGPRLLRLDRDQVAALLHPIPTASSAA